MIPYGRQSIDDDDIAAVAAVLRSDWLTQGPSVGEFEVALAERVGARHAVAFSSGTAALHGAAAASGLGPGDVVATSALTFVASANCARFVGADVALLDIDPATLNLDLRLLEPGTTGVVAVHYAGLPVDLGSLPFRPKVIIEDACHALGAFTPDGPVGSCARSDMTVFSFHPLKHITTGEGGVVTTNDSGLATRMRSFRSHGTTPRPDEGGWAYDVTSLAFNYRLSDVQAALGTSQLAKLGRFLRRRREIAARYRQELAELPLILPPAPPAGSGHAYHLFPVQLAGRKAVFDGMRAAGIGVQVHYVPLYRHSLYVDHGPPGNYPATEAAYAGLLSLPIHPELNEADQDRVIATLSALVRSSPALELGRR